MPCMCGDICCASCGPAQGNWRCEICGTIYIDGECKAQVGAGGGSNQYLYTAFDWMESNGYFAPRDRKNGGIEPPWQTAQRIGFNLAYESVEVTREKDLLCH